MASNSTISVIIPAYEPDELLVQTIQSVLSVAHQVTRPELVINVTVVDDASPSVDVMITASPRLAVCPACIKRLLAKVSARRRYGPRCQLRLLPGRR